MASKYEYFKLAYKNLLHVKRWWVLRAYSVSIPTPTNVLTGINETNLTTVGYFYFDEKSDAYYIDEALNKIKIDDHVPGQPLYGVKEPVSLKAGDFTIVKDNVESFYSNLLMNLVLYDYPFGDIFPYKTDRFNAGTLGKVIGKALKSKQITVEAYRKLTRAVSFLTCLSGVAIPAASKKSIVQPLHLLEMRNKLIEQYKDKLDDPVTVSKIEGILIEAYKEYMKGDSSNGFYIDNNSYNVTLKKVHLMFGAEQKMGKPNEVDLAIPSLSEGWKVEDLPYMANSLRMGTYHRGKETALGGEAAKFSSRIYQNTAITEDDCGSMVGVPTRITKFNQKMFNGRYVVDNGKISEITSDPVINSTILLRSPQTCHTLNGNFCKICMGRLVSEAGVGIGPQASAVGSRFLLESLAKFHASIILTTPYDYESSIE